MSENLCEGLTFLPNMAYLGFESGPVNTAWILIAIDNIIENTLPGAEK